MGEQHQDQAQPSQPALSVSEVRLRCLEVAVELRASATTESDLIVKAQVFERYVLEGEASEDEIHHSDLPR